MSTESLRPFGPGTADLDTASRDALRDVSDRFASASARRRERARMRRERYWPSTGSVMQVIGESFTLPISGRLA